MKKKLYKSQITLYLLSIIASMIVLAFVVIMVGKTAKDKTFADNAADAAALGACSVMAQAFNQNSHDNAQQEREEQQMTEARKRQARKTMENQGRDYYEAKRAVTASTPSVGLKHSRGMEIIIRGNHEEAQEKVTADTQKNTESGRDDGYQNHQDQSDAMDDYTKQALAKGYQLCFANSGTAHRLGRLNSKRYQKFMESIKPETVFSGQPKTFAWIDGSGRFHIVTCIVAIEPTNIWVLNVSQMPYSQQMEKLNEAQAQFISSHSEAVSASMKFRIAKRTWPWPSSKPPFRAGKRLSMISRESFESGTDEYMDGYKGYRNEERIVTHHPSEVADRYIKFRDDIIHSRTVMALNFQFHMGSPIKSMWGDVDIMTFYPPVQAGAIASFNYTGRGNIHRRGAPGTDPRHECGLIAAF